jgi:hypothetical protein
MENSAAKLRLEKKSNRSIENENIIKSNFLKNSGKHFQ